MTNKNKAVRQTDKMRLNMVLNTVLKNLGVDITSEDVQKLIGNKGLADIEVADALSNKMTAEYFTKEAALQNPDIISKIRAEALNGIDAHTKELMANYEFDADTMAEILREDKTSKKLSKMVEKVAELTKAKSKGDSVDKDAVNRQIEDLNKQILATKTDYEGKLAAEQAARKTDRVNWELDSIYGTLDYNLQAEKGLSITMAKAAINAVANQKGLRFETTEHGIQLLTKEGTEYYESNNKVTPSDFIKKSLIEQKLLKVSEQNPANIGFQGTPGRPQSAPTTQRQGTSSFAEAIGNAVKASPLGQ